MFLQQQHEKEAGLAFIFLRSCDVVKFKIITLLIGSFTIFSGICDAYHGRRKAKAAAKFVFVVLIGLAYLEKLENFSIILLIYFGLMQMFASLLALLSIHTDEDDIILFRLYMSLKLVTWSYFYFNFIPTRYALPLLVHLGELRASTSCAFLVWYIAELAASPFYSSLIHRLFHKSTVDCHGRSSMSKCVMLENGAELNYQTRMRRSFTEIQLYQQRINNLDKLFEDPGASDASAGNKTMQMLKCLMAMKRKVKRMRSDRRPTTSSTDADTEIDDEDE